MWLSRLRLCASGNTLHKKNPDETMIMQLDPKGKNSRSSIYISKSSFQHRLEVYKQTCHFFQYPKIVTETADAKIKIGVTKKDEKEILWVIADVNLVAKEFQKHEYYHKKHTSVQSKSDFSTSNGRFYTRFKFSHRHY